MTAAHHIPFRQPVTPIPDLDDSIVSDVDSYKLGHWLQYPRGLRSMMDYFCARGGRFSTCTLFGLQYLSHKYLAKPATHQHVARMAAFAPKHGLPFNELGWNHIVRKRRGFAPVRIRAIPEGLVVPVGLPLYTVESTDAAVPWMASWLETSLVRLWAPSTIATTSREMAKTQKEYLTLTSCDPAATHLYSVHDFGGRGVMTREQARIVNAAHLLSFLGSDTVEGILAANHYYHSDMAGFSIVASEHSTSTMRGRANEFVGVEEYIQRELVDRQVPPGVPKLAAYVGDSFDIYNFTHQVTTGRLLQMIKGSGGKFIERPDSGDPFEVLPKVLEIIRQNLGSDVTVNQKGFKVLPPYFGVIQGDGIDMESHKALLQMLVDLKWCVSTLNYGSGGGLVQKWNRDDQKWKLACSSANIDGVDVPVQKDPVTDPGKRSRPGRLDLIRKDDGSYAAVELASGQIAHPQSVMETVYEDGEIFVDHHFDECRARMAV